MWKGGDVVDLFRPDNTEGYTAAELAKLNAEWEEIAEREGLEEYTAAYDERAGQFNDEVARR